MKRIVSMIVLVYCHVVASGQSDTNYASRAVSAGWMPDGRSVLISIVKYHRTDQKAPFFSKTFQYQIASKQILPLLKNASNLAPSPGGKKIGFLKRNDNKRNDIYLFDLATKKETLFYTDTLRKNSLKWSPDGKNLVYNISTGAGPSATIEICVLNTATKQMKQITHSGKDKSYDPNWSPDSRRIVYYVEKGDNHDQIWLTDLDGSFHTNLTNDTATHNYFPSWFDDNTILYTQEPGTIMVMNADGRYKKRIEGINNDQAKYNAKAEKFIYVNTEAENTVILFDARTKQKTILLDGTKMIDKF